MDEASEFPRLSIISLGSIYYSISEFPRLSIISLDGNFHSIFYNLHGYTTTSNLS